MKLKIKETLDISGMYKLVPKNGKGSIWYVNKKEIHNKPYVPVVSEDGFETTVNIDNYIVVKN